MLHRNQPLECDIALRHIVQTKDGKVELVRSGRRPYNKLERRDKLADLVRKKSDSAIQEAESVFSMLIHQLCPRFVMLQNNLGRIGFEDGSMWGRKPKACITFRSNSQWDAYLSIGASFEVLASVFTVSDAPVVAFLAKSIGASPAAI